MRNLRLDPETRDYVLTAGRFEVDEDLSTPVFLCLETRRGTRIGDANFGSLLHTLRKDPIRSAARAPAMVREALQPLFDDGSITGVVTKAEAQSDGIVLNITITGPSETAVFRVFREVGP